MSEWISVKDRLPITEDDMNGRNYDDIDIIITDGELVEFGAFQAGNTTDFWSCFTSDDNSSIVDSEVTHWMPLPEPPNNND